MAAVRMLKEDGDPAQAFTRDAPTVKKKQVWRLASAERFHDEGAAVVFESGDVLSSR